MIGEVWKQGIVYLRHTDKNGKSHVTEHRCWNTDLFIQSQSRAAFDAKGKIDVITEVDFKNSLH